MISICDPIYLKEAEDILPSPSQNNNNNYDITLLYNSKLKKKINIAFTHKVKNDILNDPSLRRTVRREFKYTDDEIKYIIKSGKLPSLKDIKQMIKIRQNNEIDPYDIVAKSIISVEKINHEATNSNKNEIKDNNVTSININENKTFLTDVNIVNNNNHNESIENEKNIENKYKIQNNPIDEEKIDLFDLDSYFDSDSDSDEDINLNVQESLRALRHILNCSNVDSFNDANYNKPTCNSKIKSKYYKLHNKGIIKYITYLTYILSIYLISLIYIY